MICRSQFGCHYHVQRTLSHYGPFLCDVGQLDLDRGVTMAFLRLCYQGHFLVFSDVLRVES